jgi:hypothetical protein
VRASHCASYIRYHRHITHFESRRSRELHLCVLVMTYSIPPSLCIMFVKSTSSVQIQCIFGRYGRVASEYPSSMTNAMSLTSKQNVMNTY